MSEENMIVIPEENLNKVSFPITFERVIVARTKENEARYRHLTVLILGVYVNEDDKVMVINKYPKNIFKSPETFFLKFAVMYLEDIAYMKQYQKAK